MFQDEQKKDYLIGRLIDNKYEIIEKIGQGKFGYVYKTNFNSNEYALKVIPIENISDSELFSSKRLQNHDNPFIIKIFEAFTTLDTKYDCILMELCSEGNLRNKINENTHFEFNKIYRYISEIIKGLHYLHSDQIKIIHRDIKPENILLKHDHLVLTDFGLCRILSTSSSEGFTCVGTFEYLSPEIENGQPHTYKTDIWSTGCVLFELITLKRFKQEIRSSQNTNTNKMYREIPVGLKLLLKRMLIKQSKSRADIKELYQKITSNLNEINLVPLTLEEWFNDSIMHTTNFPINNLSHYLERKQLKIRELEILLESKQIIILASDHICGKTTILKKFAFNFHQNPTNCCYFLDANAIYSDLEKVANLLQIPVDLNSNIIHEISNFLKLNDENYKCLFIIDDLPSSFDFNLFNNIPNNVRFLIASKEDIINKFNSNQVHFINVDSFRNDECLELLKMCLKNKLQNEEDENDSLESLSEMIKNKPNSLDLCLKIINEFETNELDSFEDIIEKIENEF